MSSNLPLDQTLILLARLQCEVQFMKKQNEQIKSMLQSMGARIPNDEEIRDVTSYKHDDDAFFIDGLLGPVAACDP